MARDMLDTPTSWNLCLKRIALNLRFAAAITGERSSRERNGYCALTRQKTH